MEHAWDTEEAEEHIELNRSCVRSAGEVVVEALCVEAGDLVVLSAVKENHLAAFVLEIGKVVGPCSDVGRVERFGYSGIVDIEGGCVP